METQQLKEGIDALFPDGEHLPPAAQLRRAIALWLAGNPYPEIGQYAALLTQGLGNYLRREQRLRELWLDQQSSHGFTTPRDLLKHPDSRGVFILQEHSKVLRSTSVQLNVPLLCNPPPVQRVPELPPCHPTFSTLEALRTAIQEAFNSRTKADGSFENPGGVLSHFIGDWLSTCPCEDTLPDRPFAALLSDVEAWLRSGGCPGSELWTSQGHSFPPLRDFLTAPERSGFFRVVVREGHIGNDLVQLDVDAVRARAEAAAAAAQAPAPAAPTPAGANGSSSGNATIAGAAGASTRTNGAGGSASSSRDAVPSGPAAVLAAASAAASSWGSSSARPSPARQLVESAFPVLAAADGDNWHVAADRLRRAIALKLAEGPAPQLGPHCAPELWLRDFIKKRDVQPLWQAVSGRCKDVCELLVAPESRGVFRVQGLPLYPAGVVFLDMEALARRAAAPPQPQPGPASQQPAAPQQPPAPQPAPHGQTHQHTPSQQRQLQQLELLAAVGNSSAAMVTAPSSSAAPAGKHRPAEIGLAAAAAWPGDSPQCVLRRHAAAELAAAGPCAEAGGWEYAMAVVNVARLLQSTQHAALMQLQSNMGGRLHWPVLLTSNGGAGLMPLREAEQAITPLEAVAAAGDCYRHHLLRLVYGDGDAAVLLNVPELMRRHGGSAGEGAGAGGSGSGGLLVAGRAARGAGETDVSWHPQQPGSTHIAAAPTIVVPGRAGRLPDVRMTEAAGYGGGGGGAGGSTAGGGADRSRREAAAPGRHSGDGAHARHWWQQPNGAAVATDTARRPPLEAEVKFDARVESALGLTFRAAAGAEPDAQVLRCVARLLLQAPPPHTLTFPYLGLKVAQQLGRPCPGLRHMCSQRPDVFALELEGTIAIRVQLVCDRLLRLAPSPRQQQSPSRRPALQRSQQAGAGSGAHTSRITGAAPPKQDGAGAVASAVPDPDAGPSAPAAAPAPSHPFNRTAAAPRAPAGPAQRPAAARTLDTSTAAELIYSAFPLRDDGGGGRWTMLTADQAALQLRQTVAFWLLSNPELSELGPRRATVSALAKHLTKRHKGVWRNPAYGFPSLHDFLQSPDSHGVFVLYAHGSPGEPVVELDATALRRTVVAGSGQHPENGLAGGAEGTAGARAQERGRQRGSTQAAAAEGAAAAGNGAAGTAHNSGSDCGTGKRSSIGKRRSSSPTGAAGISTAAGAPNAPLVGAGVGAGAGAETGTGADGRAAGAAAASAPLEESTAALIRAAFPLQLVGNTPAPDQPARQLRQAIATWLAGNPYASELGPRRASLRSLGIYLREVCTDLWRNRAHRFPKIVEFLRSPHSRGVFFLFEKGRDTQQLHVELDVMALLHAAAAEAAEMGLVEGADSQNGGDGATAVTDGAGREPAAGAAATAAGAPAPAGAPAATPVGNELGAPAACAVPVQPLQLLQHLQQPHVSLPLVAGSVPPEPAQLGPSPVGPALAGAAEPAAMNGAAAGGDPALPRLLVPVPVSQPEPDYGATALAPPATAQPQPQSLSSVPAPATWVPVSVHAGAGFSARSVGTDGMSEEAAPAVAGDQVEVAAPDAALGSVYQAGPEALEPTAARGYVQPQQAALDEPAQQPLPEAGVCVVNDPYAEELIAMLQHCGCCTRIGLAVQAHGGRPALVSVYAPPALVKVEGPEENLLQWPAAVYLVDPLAAAASYGGGAEGEVAAAALLCSLQPLLEASSISKVIYGGGSALACLEEAIAVGSGDMFAVVRTHPLHNLRVVLKGVQLMLEVPLEPPSMPTPAGPIVPHGGVAAYLPVAASGGGGVSWLRGLHAHVARLRDALAGTGLWADRPQLLAVLASRHAAALREDAQLEDGSAGPDEDAAARVLTRPLAPSQLEAAARAARHLPELWAALVQEAVPWVAAHASTSDMAVYRNLAV